MDMPPPPLNILDDDDPFSLAEAMEMEDDPDADAFTNSNVDKPPAPPARPKPKARGPLEEWELDDSLSVRECADIRMQGSLYERERQHNMVHNRRILDALKVPAAAEDLAKLCAKPPARMPKGESAQDVKVRSGQAAQSSSSTQSGTTGSETRSTRSKTINIFERPPTPPLPSFDTVSSPSALERSISELDEFLNLEEDISHSTNGSYDTDKSSFSTSAFLNDEDEGVDHPDENAATTMAWSQGFPVAALTHSPSPPPSHRLIGVDVQVSLADGHPDLKHWPD